MRLRASVAVCAMLMACLLRGEDRPADVPSSDAARRGSVAAHSAVAVSPADRSFGWRGDGSGRYPDAAIPIEWGGNDGKNVLWRTPVGHGRSLPVVVAGRIVLTSEPDLLLAVDAATGRPFWERGNGYDMLPPDIARPEHKPSAAAECGYATPTVVTDGEWLYASFGTGIVICYDIDGRRKWIRYLDIKQTTDHGRSVSPVLVGGKLIVSLGGLVALDPESGTTLWQTPEAEMAYGTPAAVRIRDVDLLITPQGDCVRVADGKVLSSGLARMSYASPIVQSGVVYFIDVTSSAYQLPDEVSLSMDLKKLWESEDMEGDIFASPLFCKGVLYTASNGGVLYAIDARTGKTLFKQDLPIRSGSSKPDRRANVYASMVLAGERLLVGNDVGETLVLQPDRLYKELAYNTLDGGSGATAVPDRKRLLLRAGTMLYCIGSP